MLAGLQAASNRRRQLDDQFVAAWNSRDAEQLLSLMAYDVMYDDAGWPAYMHGHTDVRAFLESTWRAVPDLSFAHDDTVLVAPSGTNTARYWTGAGTHTGVWSARSDPNGRQFQFRGASFLEIHDGELRRIRVVYDVTDMRRQLGVLPARSSAAERLIIRAANFTHPLASTLKVPALAVVRALRSPGAPLAAH